MVLRIWFTAEDIARTGVATPDPLAETVFSLIRLRSGPLAGWRQQTRRRLTPPLRHLGGMAPGLPVLDVLTVAGRTSTIAEGIDRLLGAPRALEAEAEYFAREHNGTPPSLRPLLHTHRGVHRNLARALYEYHEVAVAPYWPRLSAYLNAQRKRAGSLMLDGGVAALFAALGRHGLRWKSPVLEVPTSRAGPGPDRTCHLGGRGLLLAPSLFFGPHPVIFTDPGERRQTMLVYPVLPEPIIAADLWSSPVDRSLAGLLGGTRARVLTVADGCTTTELARRAGISLSSASEHARVLREAGLLHTERRGPEVEHTITDLGVRLLDHGW